MSEARPLVFGGGRPLEPGRYRRDGFVPSLSFEVGDGWFAVQDAPGFFDVQRDPGTPDVIAVQLARPADAVAAEAFVAALQARDDLTVGTPTPVTVGGAGGVAVVVDAADADRSAGGFVPVLGVAAGPISIADGRRLEVLLVDRPDGLLAVLVGGSVRGWAAARAAAGPVVASIRFDDVASVEPGSLHPLDWRTLPRWGFASPGPLRDELTALALAGTKTATAALVVEFELDGEAVPQAGDLSVLIDSGERPVAVIETTSCRVLRLADVDDAHAIDEGEGYADAAAFRVAHERYWNGYLDRLRERLGDPTFSLTDDTLIAAERFRIVERLDAATAAG